MDEGLDERIDRFTRGCMPSAWPVGGFVTDLITAYRASQEGLKRLRARYEGMLDAAYNVERLVRDKNKRLQEEVRIATANAEMLRKRLGEAETELESVNATLDNTCTAETSVQHQRDVAEAEVKRLRHSQELWAATYDRVRDERDRADERYAATDADLARALKVVERLRAERDGWKNYNSATLEAWNVRVAAIERAAGEALRSLEGENKRLRQFLRADRKYFFTALDAAHVREEANKAEIERLNDMNDALVGYLKLNGISVGVLEGDSDV